MSAWIWFARRFGIRMAFWWWRQGRKHGWMTEEQAAALFAVLDVARAALSPVAPRKEEQ